MLIYVLRRYGLAIAIAFVLADVLVAYLVGSTLLEWEVGRIRDALE